MARISRAADSIWSSGAFSIAANICIAFANFLGLPSEVKGIGMSDRTSAYSGRVRVQLTPERTLVWCSDPLSFLELAKREVGGCGAF